MNGSKSNMMDGSVKNELFSSVDNNYPYVSVKTRNVNWSKYKIPSPHRHNSIEMIYVFKGSMTMKVCGNTYRLTKGDFIIINSWEIHKSIICRGEYCDLILVKFSPDILITNIRNEFYIKYIHPLITKTGGFPCLLKAEELMEKKSLIPFYMDAIHTEYLEKEYAYEIAIRSHIYSILLEIYRNFNVSQNIKSCLTVSDQNIISVQRAITFIHDNYQKNITTQEVAKVCAISYTHLSRIFKMQTGSTISQYIESVRMAEAEKMLITTDFPIFYIAEQTGFKYVNNFIKRFKEYKKITPRRFRANYAHQNKTEFSGIKLFLNRGS